MESYGHGELSGKSDINKIENSIKLKEFFINPDIKLKKVEIDDTFPNYIKNNIPTFSSWIDEK